MAFLIQIQLTERSAGFSSGTSDFNSICLGSLFNGINGHWGSGSGGGVRGLVMERTKDVRVTGTFTHNGGG